MSTSLVSRPPAADAAPPAQRTRLSRLLRPAARPGWERPALLGLLAATGLLYLWGLSASGYANSFYAAAAQAGGASWKAWFFGALDPASSITVDKPPASLWVMGLSVRVFGLSSWSVLVPQALEGVAAVGLLYATVRRVSGSVAGLLAGAGLALTPAAVLMFRFDNPDALLTLLLVAAAYAVTRALEQARTKWLALAGTAIGFAFLAKMLQGFLTLPSLALVYLLFAPTGLWRRIWQLLVAGVAVLVSAGWWVAIAQLWPASSRPYIAGSGDNSLLGLALGYNGLGRIFGGQGNGGNGGGGAGGPGGGAAGSSFGGATGLSRLFSSEMGNEVSWLLPAALVALLAGLWLTLETRRTDRGRAAFVLWGGWLLVTGLLFSYMKGTIHPYYTVALAPSIAALVALAAVELWRRRSSPLHRVWLALLVVAAGSWSWVLLARNAWHPELRYAVAGLTVVAAAGLLVPPARLGRAGAALALAGVLAGLGGTAAYALPTAASAHTGSIPSVGPVSAQSDGMGRGDFAFGGAPGGGTTSGSTSSGSAPSTGGAMQGPDGGSANSALTAALKSTTTTWAAATTGATSAADLQLASGRAVMDIGGWSGSDDSPTLAQFQADVKAGKIAYFVVGGMSGRGGMGGSQGSSSAITSWVEAHYKATTIGGTTVYDLRTATS